MQLNEFLGNKAEEITQEDVIEWLNNNKNSHSHAKRIPITACYDTKANYLKLHEVSIKSNTTYIERFLFELPSWHSMINKNNGISGTVGKCKVESGKMFVIIPSDKARYVFHDAEYLKGTCSLLGINEMTNESIEKWISHMIDHFVEHIPNLEVHYDSAESYSGFKHRFTTAVELLLKYDPRFKAYDFVNKPLNAALNQLFAPDFHGNNIQRHTHIPSNAKPGQDVYLDGTAIAIDINAYKSLIDQGHIK